MTWNRNKSIVAADDRTLPSFRETDSFVLICSNIIIYIIYDVLSYKMIPLSLAFRGCDFGRNCPLICHVAIALLHKLL